MKHLIETANPSGLAITEYDRIILNSTTNDVIVGGGVTYEYVDLGLSVKWAKCNVGAKSETDYGDYFMWGDIVDKSNADCSWSSYKYGDGDNFSKYNTGLDDIGGTIDNKTTLDLEDDAAKAHMGGDWRMPTKAEFQELLDNTDKLWTTINGVNGYKFTSNKEGYQNNSIFIPAAGIRSGSSFSNQGEVGDVWSSSLYAVIPSVACALYFSSDSIQVDDGNDRKFGFPVRGVCE